MTLMAGTKLGRYEIRSKIGAGGMGEVYLAQDTKLDRKVALKVLPAGVATNRERMRRFVQEAKAASGLNHPNIITVYEIDETDSNHFIVMEFVEGETLREHMTVTSVKLTEAIEVAIQITSALAVAHEAGIIHRDIKPENIIVRPDGYLKVLDFGLAKLAGSGRRASEPEAETVPAMNTEPGMIVGTLKYMSPEQARGIQVDSRSDIWGLGVLLYEMIAGKPPFDGLTKSDVLASILKTAPAPLNRTAPNIPAELDRIVKKALRKDPEDRYASANDLLVDLRNLRREVDEEGKINQAVDQEVSSVAILPFKNLLNDSAVGFYEFSLADAVITELVRLRSLVVRPSTAIAKYIGQATDPLEAARELKVTAVLAASFLCSASRIRVTVQLMDVAKGEVLWGDRIDSHTHDIISVQDTIAQRIVDGLRLELSPDERVDLAGHATTNASAYEEYLRGRDRLGRFIYHTVALEDLEVAIEHFQRAITLDSTFALAHCGLGGCHIQRINKGSGKAEDVSLAREALERGLAFDPAILEARLYMVFVYLKQGEKQKARKQIARLRVEAPNSASVQYVSGVLYRLDGEYDQALRSFDEALRLNPGEAVVTSWSRARIYMYQGRYDDALLELDRGAAIEPNHPVLQAYRAQCLLLRGDCEVAGALFQEILANHSQMDALRPLLAQCLSAAGEHAASLAQLTERVKEGALLDHDVPYWVGTVYAMEGEDEEALYWLRKAITLGNENLPWFELNPAWARLRQNPEFQMIIQAVKQSRSSDES